MTRTQPVTQPPQMKPAAPANLTGPAERADPPEPTAHSRLLAGKSCSTRRASANPAGSMARMERPVQPPRVKPNARAARRGPTGQAVRTEQTAHPGEPSPIGGPPRTERPNRRTWPGRRTLGGQAARKSLMGQPKPAFPLGPKPRDFRRGQADQVVWVERTAHRGRWMRTGRQIRTRLSTRRAPAEHRAEHRAWRARMARVKPRLRMQPKAWTSRWCPAEPLTRAARALHPGWPNRSGPPARPGQAGQTARRQRKKQPSWMDPAHPPSSMGSAEPAARADRAAHPDRTAGTSRTAASRRPRLSPRCRRSARVDWVGPSPKPGTRLKQSQTLGGTSPSLHRWLRQAPCQALSGGGGPDSAAIRQTLPGANCRRPRTVTSWAAPATPRWPAPGPPSPGRCARSLPSTAPRPQRPAGSTGHPRT